MTDERIKYIECKLKQDFSPEQVAENDQYSICGILKLDIGYFKSKITDYGRFALAREKEKEKTQPH